MDLYLSGTDMHAKSSSLRTAWAEEGSRVSHTAASRCRTPPPPLARLEVATADEQVNLDALLDLQVAHRGVYLVQLAVAAALYSNLPNE